MAAESPVIWAVIPARYAATRLPGKPLVTLEGKPMIQRVWERALQAKRVAKVVVATDDERIRSAVQSFGGEAIMTRTNHSSGTSRIAEVAVSSSADIFINVQGDEPLVAPEAVDTLAECIAADDSIALATLAVQMKNSADIMDPNICKVVLDFDDNALYFSRAPIPWVRDSAGKVHARHWKHLGLYAYRRAALLDYETLPPGELERVEQLEQLRWLENGYKIRVAETWHDSISVDIPEDVARVEKLIREAAVE
ncbi:MAG TPA: 3-deoxy-manno-octulosonate cytidylyltransferase [Candidatus Acidoferrales bacterium]|nr:3-deoxy-manno-octulosonate cytidylyltransferase [Candidatus Acidoferrales bacterium]